VCESVCEFSEMHFYMCLCACTKTARTVHVKGTSVYVRVCVYFYMCACTKSARTCACKRHECVCTCERVSVCALVRMNTVKTVVTYCGW